MVGLDADDVGHHGMGLGMRAEEVDGCVAGIERLDQYRQAMCRRLLRGPGQVVDLGGVQRGNVSGRSGVSA